ncbi:MAG TPA: PilW family protein [Thermoanaerobaculia bacterium]|nr:PilW family protein [Thermoanaerobaculia bacterium]
MTQRSHSRASAGFTLIEMIVVTLLLAIAMLGILAVFDASARINKSESEVADAQGNVRFGVYQMTRVIRMAGAGGLHVGQAIVTQTPAGLLGITASKQYDNVNGVTITDINSVGHTVRNGTDMIEVRGVILSPLYSLLGNGCGGCNGASASLAIPDQVNNAQLPAGLHYNNDDTNRPQFNATVAYTSTVTAASPMFFLVASGEDQSIGCSTPPAFPRYPLPIYNVAVLKSAATRAGNTLTFASLDFTNARAEHLNGPDPQAGVPPGPIRITNLSRGGVLDDIVYFIDDTDPQHPALAQGTRRGDSFDVVPIADDVEDMQIAYGVDLNGDGVDPGISTTSGGDEWTPNVTGEAFGNIPSFVSAGTTCPNLHSVMISLLAKSHNPDPAYRAPSATGFRLMNVAPAAPALPMTAMTNGNYRRRVQTLRIALRNYSFEEQ